MPQKEDWSRYRPVVSGTGQLREQLKSPEKKLLSAMLLRAWADWWSSSRLTHVDARNWLNFYEEEAFSFSWVCDYLELCPHQVRKMIVTHPFTEHFLSLAKNRYKKTPIVLTTR